LALDLIIAVGVVAIILNAWTTRVVLRDHLSSRDQRAGQIAFIWFLPVVGALLTLYLKRTDPEPSSGHYAETPDPGDDFGRLRPRLQDFQSHSDLGDAASGEGGSSD
jgi:hypothetical protein